MAKTIDARIDETRATEADERRLAARERRKELLRRWFWRFAGYAFIIGLWDIASGTIMSDRLLVPPIAIVREIGEIFQSGELWFHLSSTLTKIAIGFTLAFIVGTIIGLLSQYR
ncbi:MAG TPA: hypothetical protein VE889_01690, partial [Actinomycetota bacterium]|nr:hypothetical protein [Actinomycetota bacterium]